MRILNLKAQNLFSLGDVELNLDKQGLLLITGHSEDEGGNNASGKSGLSNKALLWILFGQTASGDKADSVINRFADPKASCIGSLDLESNNGCKFRIIRSRRPNKLTILDLSTHEDISCKAEKDTQTLIDKILGRTREIFLQTDFFGQGKAANFLDLASKAQMDLLETILPFEALNKLGEDAKGFLDKLKVLQSVVERDASECNGKILEAQRQERELSAAIDSWEAKHLAAITAIEAEIAAIPSKPDLETKTFEYKQMLSKLHSREEYETKLSELNASVIANKKTVIGFENTKNLYSIERNNIKYVPKPKEHNVCPTCNQNITSDLYERLHTDYEKYYTDLKDIEYRLTECNKNIILIQDYIKDDTDIIHNIEAFIKQIDVITVELAKIEDAHRNDNLAVLIKNMEELKLEVNPYERLYNNNASALTGAMAALGHHKLSLANIDNDKKALEFWQEAFNKELKNEFLTKVCPFIESRANIHLNGLGNGQIKIRVSTLKTLKSNEDRSEFNVSVLSSSGGATYDSLSGGEKQMTNFAMGLALADLAETQVSGPSKFMVLDEPFMSLDARNSENLVGYLNSYLLSKKETILMVSNEETLKALIPNRIHVIKENGVSRICNA